MVLITEETPSECIFINNHNHEFAELACVKPFLRPVYTHFEIGIDNGVWDVMRVNSWFPVVMCALYVFLIFWGKYVYMKDKEAWKGSRPYLAGWNFVLSAFSFIGSFRVATNMIYNLLTLSIRDNFCIDPEITYGSGSTGLWVQLFVLSKFPELFDTFFIVVNKKPLIFLHWYHHITVLLFCWYSYITYFTGAIYFVFMNYTVHAFMYCYYFLVAIRMKPKWVRPIFITTIQILQMIGGVIITCIMTYFYFTEKEGECFIVKKNITSALIMYVSYLALFVDFFVKKYFKIEQDTGSSTGLFPWNSASTATKKVV